MSEATLQPPPAKRACLDWTTTDFMAWLEAEPFNDDERKLVNKVGIRGAFLETLTLQTMLNVGVPGTVAEIIMKKVQILLDPRKTPVKITLGACELTTTKGMLRDNWDTGLPTAFDIGAMDTFATPFLQQEFFSKFSNFVKKDSAEGNRRGFASIVAMPGWGKTYAMTLLAKLTTACRMTTQESNDPVLNKLRVLILSNSRDQASVDLLKRCIPLAITLNSNMELTRDATSYNEEIAVRLAYAYLADVTKTMFPTWRAQTGSAKLTCGDVLTGLWAMAKTNCGDLDPIMLVLIDEPDHAEGARDVMSILRGTAMLKTFGVDCRVVLSALEQEWLFADISASGRPIQDLKTLPPTQEQLVDMLRAEMRGRLPAGTSESDVTEVANYIAALTGGHWRTISTAFKSVTQSRQLTVQAMKLAVGDFDVYVPSFWELRVSNVMKQLEEALAHSIIGSKLSWMEPLSDGASWQAVTSGVIQRYLGSRAASRFNKVVPIVSLLLLQSLTKTDAPEDSSLMDSLAHEWHSQSAHEVRDSLLRKVLATARFVPSADISDNVVDHQLYENMAAQYMLMRWDAYCRIDTAVRRRWSLSAGALLHVPAAEETKTNLMLRVPDSAKAKANPNYEVDEVAALRDAANQAWTSSLGFSTTPTEAPASRPLLWLVPSESDLENDLRLHVFRGATVCTATSKNTLQVRSPDPEKAKYFKCQNKLTTNGATVVKNSSVLPQGSVIEPAAGNDGFDTLVLLEKASDGWAIALMENKFELSNVAIGAVKAKLGLLKKYRGVLWKDQGDATPTSAAGLGLPSVDEADVVWVLLADKGWTKELPSQIVDALKEAGSFRGHVLLIESDDFFGPCFGKIGILDRNAAAKRRG